MTKILVMGLLVLWTSNQAFAKVAFLNTNTGTLGNGTGTNYTNAFTVNAGGTNTAAFACIVYDKLAGEFIVSVTYGGQRMYSAGPAAIYGSPQFVYAEVYYLTNPPTGSNNLSVDVGGTGGANNEVYENVVAFTGVNQTIPIRGGTYQNTINQSLPFTMTITSNVVDLTMSCFSDTTAPISSTNQTSDGINNGGNYSQDSDHATTASSSISDTWTQNGPSGDLIAMVGLSINGDREYRLINNAKINNAKFGH
jgi:hypothetical protein